jgi:hypothetical protein
MTCRYRLQKVRVVYDLRHTDSSFISIPDFRDISNETFNKDKEARRQFVTKIIDSKDSEGPLQPGETKRIVAYVQAPFKKGKKSIKIIIYYNVPDNYPKIR